MSLLKLTMKYGVSIRLCSQIAYSGGEFEVWKLLIPDENPSYYYCPMLGYIKRTPLVEYRTSNTEVE